MDTKQLLVLVLYFLQNWFVIFQCINLIFSSVYPHMQCQLKFMWVILFTLTAFKWFLSNVFTKYNTITETYRVSFSLCASSSLHHQLTISIYFNQLWYILSFLWYIICDFYINKGTNMHYLILSRIWETEINIFENCGPQLRFGPSECAYGLN